MTKAKHNVHMLSGHQLDLAVAKALKHDVQLFSSGVVYVGDVNTWAKPGSREGLLCGQLFNPSSRHGLGGPLIDEHSIGSAKHIGQTKWKAWIENGPVAWGSTRLEAAMKVIVISKLGQQVEL